jgi:Ca2+-binding EF-hand superfamily protein
MTKSIFSIFDDGSGCTNIDLIFERLSQNLEISVSESEVKNIFEEVNDSSQITLDDFLSLLT